MRMTKWLVLLCLLVAIGLAPMAFADDYSTVTMTLSNYSGTGSIGSPPFGYVTITSTGTNSVSISVTLANGGGFVNTGASNGVQFSIVGDPAITIGLPSGWAQATTLGGDHTGTFDYGLNCTVCGSGGSNPYYQTLVFTVTLSGAGTLTPSDFLVGNQYGWYFAADVIGNGGTTGPVEATGGSTVPEPTTLLMFGTGLMAAGWGGLRRRWFLR